MIGSLICLIISIVFRITIGTLAGTKFEFLADWIPYANYICIGCAALFVLFGIKQLLRKKE